MRGIDKNGVTREASGCGLETCFSSPTAANLTGVVTFYRDTLPAFRSHYWNPAPPPSGMAHPRNQNSPGASCWTWYQPEGEHVSQEESSHNSDSSSDHTAEGWGRDGNGCDQGCSSLKPNSLFWTLKTDVRVTGPLFFVPLPNLATMNKPPLSDFHNCLPL